MTPSSSRTLPGQVYSIKKLKHRLSLGRSFHPPTPFLRLDHASISELHIRADHGWCSVFGGSTGAGNNVARLQGSSRPSIISKVIQAHHFHFPFHDIALFILHLEINECMRIRPFKSLHDPADRHRVGHVVHGRGMVRDGRRGHQGAVQDQPNGKNEYEWSHGSPLEIQAKLSLKFPMPQAFRLWSGEK